MGVIEALARLVAPTPHGIDGDRSPQPPHPKAEAEATETWVRADGALVSLATGLGGSRDPRLSIVPGKAKVIGQREADDLRHAEWTCRKYIEDLPAQATRKPIDLSIVDAPRDTLTKEVMDRFEDLGASEHLRRALELERQYGGSAVVVLTKDGAESDKPLELETLSEIRGLEVASRYRFQMPMASDLETDPKSERYGLPVQFRLRRNGRAGRDVIVHWTRLIVFQGHQFRESENWEWGASELDTFWPAARDYQSAMDHALTLSGRGSETVLKTHGLRKLLASPEKDKARDYLREVQFFRSSLKIWALDKEDEAQIIAPSLTGYEDLIRIARENLTGAWGRSLASLFGTPKTGLGDGDEGEAQRDDAVIAQYRKDKLLGPWNRLVELVLAEKGLTQIASWQVQFQSLREEQPKARAERREIEARTHVNLYQAGIIEDTEVRSSLRGDLDSPYDLMDDDLRVPDGE